MSVAIPRQRVERDGAHRIRIGDDISSPGLVMPVHWAAAEEATDVEVADASLRFEAALAEETFQDVPVSNDGVHRIVTVPAGRSVKSIGLDVSLLAGQRLTLSLPGQAGGWEAPIFASEGVSNGAMAPPSPERAPFANGVFTLPRAVSAARLRLSVVTGDKITDFQPIAFTISRVNLNTETPPRNISVLGPDGAPVWQAPELPAGSPPVVVDLKTPIEIALKTRIDARSAPDATITVSADAPGRALVYALAVRGSLLRSIEGVTAVTLDGIARPLPIAAPPPTERPTSVIGDLTVRYDGLRILEAASDRMPDSLSAVAGVIVGAAPATRALPPAALTGITPARLGVLGRAPEDCEIAFEFVRMVGSTAAQALGAPAVLKASAGGQIALHWIDVPPGLTLTGPTGVRARANRGRFFWVANGDQPAVRIAIHDPNPAGRPLTIGSASLPIGAAVEAHPKYAFLPADFAGAFPRLSSDLFLTVEISDLTLRYAR